jgi:hypothetical protein
MNRKFLSYFPASVTREKFEFGFLTAFGVQSFVVPLRDYPQLKADNGDDGFLIMDGHALEFSADSLRPNTINIGRYIGEVA